MRKTFKRALALTLCLTTALSLGTGCSKKEEGGKTYKVGMCQIIEHVALDQASQGFKDALKEALGDQVEFDEQNAQGESANCATIMNTFVSSNYDLILANATAPLQAAANATEDIPILGTSITEYGVALDIDNFNGKTGINVSGTSDLAPLDQQAAMVKELFPDCKKVGLVYCSAEPNSKYQVEQVAKYLKDLGIESENFAFTDSNDITAVVTNAVEKSDVLYVPTDNTAANNTAAIDAVARDAKKPIIAGEEGICSGCGVATLSISYYDIGYETGKMAAEILKDGKDIKDMEIKYAPTVTKKYNKEICAALGVTIPDGYEAIVTD